MKNTIKFFCIGLALAGASSVAPAQAALRQTYVSSHGNNSNSCAINAPCRTFAHAITQTAAGGSIIVLDSANYGTLAITKAINIVNDGGATATISVPANAVGIKVNLGAEAAAVTLRGLTIEGGGVGANGIAFIGTGTLNVLDCMVRGMQDRGISVTASFGGNVVIANTTTTNNTNYGVYATGDGSGSLTLSLSHVRLTNNGSGFYLTGGTAAYGFVTVDSSLIAQNTTGLALSASGSNTITAFVTGSNILNNTNSINVGAGTQLKLERTSVATSYSGGITNNGTIRSFGDNAILDTVTGNAISAVALK